MNRKAMPRGPALSALAPLLLLSAMGCSTADPPLESQTQSEAAGSVPASAVESTGDGGTQALDAGGSRPGHGT